MPAPPLSPSLPLSLPMPPNPHPKPPLILVTGPSRSGKSEWAEWLANHSHKPVTYVATAAIAP
ncbi:MAG TPA: bifunctional adenosylcobinamide kinase/adenosylcobinamide-phosphate guanylyltransferase, partial [Chroococcidiopsis sp.]